MANKLTKSLDTVYTKARLRAAEYNPDFLSRSTSLKYLDGISEDCLKDYERGQRRPSNDVVAMMAEAYNCPELRTWYCANECMLGRDCVDDLQSLQISDTSIKLLISSKGISDALNTLFETLADGQITSDEIPELLEVKKKLQKVKKHIEEVSNAIEKKTRAFGAADI